MKDDPQVDVHDNAHVSFSKNLDNSRRGNEAFAWLQCAGAFFLFFNSWGLVNTFGEYSYL